MIMRKALHPRDDVDRLYVSRKEGGSGLISLEYSVDTTIQLEDYIENIGGRLIISTRNNTNNTRTRKTTITTKKREEKNLWTF